MTEFKVGDVVRLEVDWYDGGEVGDVKKGSLLKVSDSCETSGQWIDTKTVKVEMVNKYKEEFILISNMKNKFAVGDKVILANPKAASGHELEEGWIGYVIDPNEGSGDIPVHVASEKNSNLDFYFDEDELELLGAAKKEEHLANYLIDMFSKPDPELEKSVEKLNSLLEAEYTGGSSSYYKVDVANPTTSDSPYQAECNDVIEALGLTFTEGNIFKAIWRIAADRQGKKKKGNNSVYDAEKVVFFAERLLIQEKNKEGK